MTITLKDGSSSEDSRLDFIPYKDERSKSYPAVELLGDQPQLQYKNYFPGEWFDQGPDGACTAFAICHELVSSPVRYTDDINPDTARRMYHEAQHIDPWPGCSRGMSCMIEPTRKKYEGTSMLATLTIAKNRGYIEEYRWAFGEEDLAMSVSNIGPAVIGVMWHAGMYNTGSKNYLKATGGVQGGHAVVVAGFDPKKDRYKIWNSWGRSWGLNGWAYVARDTMASLLKDNGEAAIPLKRAGHGSD